MILYKLDLTSFAITRNIDKLNTLASPSSVQLNLVLQCSPF